jgi:hypothetical protein
MGFGTAGRSGAQGLVDADDDEVEFEAAFAKAISSRVTVGAVPTSLQACLRPATAHPGQYPGQGRILGIIKQSGIRDLLACVAYFPNFFFFYHPLNSP